MKSFLIRRQTASFRIVILMLAIVPLCLVEAIVPANGQTSSATPSPGDWTEFHRDNMQRWNPYETVLGVNNVGGLQLKWKTDLSDNSYGTGFFPPRLVSSPAVVNGVAYVGSYDGNVYALNASTGARLWTFSSGGEVVSSPALANGLVYVATEGGMLISPSVFALNANTGTLLWSYVTSESVASSPVVVNGVVYTTCGDSTSGSPTVCALNARTGSLLWNHPTASAVESSPAVVNGVVYFGDDSGKVSAVNAGTGALLWTFGTGSNVVSSPAVANGVVYIGSGDHNVYALNAGTGSRLWSFGTGDQVWSSPAVANGVVYVGSDDGNVYALNADTGAKLWSYDTGDPVEYSSPALANGAVYISSGDESVYALNAGTGAKLWSTTPGANYSLSSSTVVNGVVYIGGVSVNGIDAYNLVESNVYAFSVGADLFLRIFPTPTTVHQGDLITYAFPVWNLGPGNADYEVLNTQVPEGTTLDYFRISGTPGLGTCTAPPYQGTGTIVCHENSAMAPNTTWTVRLTVKVTAPAGTVITENAAVTEDTLDPNLANNMATVSTTVQ